VVTRTETQSADAPDAPGTAPHPAAPAAATPAPAAPEVYVRAAGLRKVHPGQGAHGAPKEAVAGIDFTVRRGEAFGFLGPNGAGKSTTMR
jgi:ABC-type glutathione transport system ATPase component